MEATTGFVALCDMLGFTDLVENSDVSQLYYKYRDTLREAKEKFLETITSTRREEYRPSWAIFSDTILLWDDRFNPAESTVVDFNFYDYVGIIFNHALIRELPLRIGIAYGEYIMDPGESIYLGKAIVNAYKVEKAQDWVGVACHESCPPSQTGEICLVKYAVPTKICYDGPPLYQTIDWPWCERDKDGLRSILIKQMNKAEEKDREKWENTLKYFESSAWQKKYT